MTDVISTLDDYGRPAWLALMVAAFIIAWPLGLAVIGYLIWSGRMGRFTRGDARANTAWGEKMKSWGTTAGGFDRGRSGASGNHAFDEYRSATLRRLEEEEKEFRDYLDRLRLARDREEFDRFMGERKSDGKAGGPSAPEAGQPNG